MKALALLALALVVAGCASGKPVAARPSPTSVALHLQRQFASYVAGQEPRPQFPRARRATFVRLLDGNSARFHYGIKRLQVLPGRDGAPLIVLRATGSLPTFSKSLPALERLLDPLRRTPRIACCMPHTKYEAFFLEAVDAHNIPFVVVWNVWRQPQGGGGQWAREESLLPFAHG